MFEVGDKVVYPHHGAGTVLAREFHDLRGERREYLTIEILQPPMTVMVPCENAEVAGLRSVINERAVGEVLSVLAAEGSEMPAQWNQRFKRNQEKLRSGDILELAEVVRNLERRQQDARLSPGEMQMLERARRVLVSEMMYARRVDEEAASQLIDDVLSGKLVIKHKAGGKRISPLPPPKLDPKAAAAARAAAAQQSRAGMRPSLRPVASAPVAPTPVAPVAKAAAKPAAKVVAKPAAKAPAKVVAKPAAKAPAKVAAKPAAKAPAKKAAKVAAKPAAKAPAKVAAKVATKKPAAKAPAKATAKPAAKPAAKAPAKKAAPKKK